MTLMHATETQARQILTNVNDLGTPNLRKPVFSSVNSFNRINETEEILFPQTEVSNSV